MRIRTALTLTLLLTTVVTAPVHADTFGENFDDGTIDASLIARPPAAGFAIAVSNQALEFTKASGTGNGEALLQSRFALSGDFTAAVRATRVDLNGAGELGLRAVFQSGAVAEIYFIGIDSLQAAINGPPTSTAESATAATLQIRRTGNDIVCEIDTGAGFAAKSSLTSPQLGKAKVRLELFLRQTLGLTGAHTGRFDDIAVVAAAILGGGGGPTPTPTPTGAAGPTPTPRPTPPTLDHFMSYGVKGTKGTPPFFALGPVTLGTLLGGQTYDVLKVGGLLLPADKNGEGRHDVDTHLLEYRIKPTKDGPKFATLADVRVLNQCNDVFVQLTKPVSLLVPTAKDLSNPVLPPIEANHQRDHFLCFQAKAQKKRVSGATLPKFPKGIQVVVADQFQTRRYDLTKLSKLCLPTDKSGAPRFLKGPDKGNLASLALSSLRHADEHLVCYKAKLATTEIAQLGCGPAVPGAKGAKITKQAKHTPKSGIFAANQLGALRLDSTKEIEFCVPSLVEFPTG